MPYIPKSARPDLEWMFHPDEIGEIIFSDSPTRPASPGELNYCVSRLIDNYIYDTSDNRKLSYSKFNEVLGVLEAVKLELYYRFIGRYEDDKWVENGEVFCHVDTMMQEL